MAEYVPSTEIIRGRVGVFPTHGSADDWRAEFDAWLTAHDAEVAAKAWDEGWSAGVDDQSGYDPHFPWQASDNTPNPYIERSE